MSTTQDRSAETAGGRVLERTRRWVEQETPSGDVERARALADDMAGAFRQVGADIDLVDAPGWGAHLRARLPGREPELEPVLVLGHLDTVWPVGTLESMPFRVEDGRAYGPGIFDMKAPLAVLVEAFHRLAGGAGPRRPVHVLITCDEEVGSPTSRPLIEAMADEAGVALVLEPSLRGGRVKTARKGVAIYTLRVTGRSAHAGLDPEAGISAVTELAHQILRIQDLADPKEGTTVNVGVVAGGTASNVVPEEATAEVEARYRTAAEGRRVDAAMRALSPVLEGAKLDLTGGENRPPLERTEAVVRLYRHARRLAEEIGFELGEGAAGGASDGCFTAARGVPTLDGLGVQGDGAHAAHEHIVISDLPRRVALLARLLETV